MGQVISQGMDQAMIQGMYQVKDQMMGPDKEAEQCAR